MNADDVELIAQGETFEKLDEILNKDLSVVQKYFKLWHSTLNSNKITSVAFH